MPSMTVTIDDESFRRLAAVAIEQRRAIPMQAEVILLQALGRWPVPDAPIPTAPSPATPEAAR